MHWKQFYYVRDYLKSSLWIVPLIAIPLELAATRILHRLDEWLDWTFLDLGVSGAQAMINPNRISETRSTGSRIRPGNLITP